ncbi:MAG: serine hydrolase [bacterium]
MTRRTSLRSLAFIAAALAALGVAAYPLDGYEETGIRRLEGNRLADEGLVRDVKQPPGAKLGIKEVDLRLLGQTSDLPTPDAAFTRQITALLSGGMDGYGLAVLDLSDPAKPRYAEHRGAHRQNVGSVGKIVVALALFQGLADTYPQNIGARQRVLKTTIVTADGFSQSDHHTVRMYDPATRKLVRRTIRIGDQASLYEYLDWMLSPSSNSAAGMVMREAMLIRQLDPVAKNGLDPEGLRQGSIFTATGKRKVPGPGGSYGTARELMRYLLRMEQGRLVDIWSSREIKRMLYVTERRIRYASSPALREAAVYFKSGSLYQCAPEPGYTCRKYAGNVKNYMNSAAIVESPAGERRIYYMTTLITNVLRKNSAAEHQGLATQLQRLVSRNNGAR